jgi:hypothetical protein
MINLTPRQWAAQLGLETWWKPWPGMPHQTVVAVLKRRPYGHVWRVRCPYCKQMHTHSAGERGQDPRDFLGGRIAHCHRGHYELVEQQGTVS